MSADRIGETCPECGDGTLREWYDFGLVKQNAGQPVILRMSRYQAICRECGFRADMTSVNDTSLLLSNEYSGKET